MHSRRPQPQPAPRAAAARAAAEEEEEDEQQQQPIHGAAAAPDGPSAAVPPPLPPPHVCEPVEPSFSAVQLTGAPWPSDVRRFVDRTVKQFDADSRHKDAWVRLLSMLDMRRQWSEQRRDSGHTRAPLLLLIQLTSRSFLSLPASVHSPSAVTGKLRVPGSGSCRRVLFVSAQQRVIGVPGCSSVGSCGRRHRRPSAGRRPLPTTACRSHSTPQDGHQQQARRRSAARRHSERIG